MNDDPGFARFLAEMSRTPLLTAAEERHLALRVQRGDLAAKERMVAANLRLVVHIARGYQRADNGLTLPDLVQEGTFGLVRAVEKFDPRRGLRFSTYATIWIRQAIARSIMNKSRAIRLPANVEQDLLALRRAERSLAAELGREPTDAECAGQLDWPEAKVDAVRRSEHTVVSLHQPVAEDADTELGELLRDDEPSPFEQVAQLLRTEEVRAALDALPSRERALLELRYGLGAMPPMTCSEAARRLGLRRRQAVRIEELALQRLRARGGALSAAA